jgi:hypothetical protein
MNSPIVHTSRMLLLLLASAVMFSCSDSVQIEEVEDTFAVYLLRDTSLTANAVAGKSLNSLILADTALILVSDLKTYRWQEHTFTLNEQVSAVMDSLKRRRNVTHGVPFVVVVGLDRIYFGTFWWSFSSSIPPACAVIDILAGPPYTISLPQGAPEYRNDSRIRTSLKKYGVLIE